MAFRKLGLESCLKSPKIAPSHGEADIHPIRMQRFKPTEASPHRENLGVFQEGHQQVLVITRQSNDRGRPFAACKLLDHLLGAKTAVDIIAQEYRYSMIKRPGIHICAEVLGHFTE